MPTANTKLPEQPPAAPPPRLVARLAFRLPDDVAESWRQQAAGSGSSLSDWVRSKVDAAQTTGIASPAKAPKRRHYTPVDPELLRHVAMIGNNLNQIARGVNSQNGVATIEILASLSSLRQDLSILIDKNSEADHAH